MEAFTEQRNICKWLHITNLNWCQTHITHFLSRYMHFCTYMPLLTWHKQESFHSQHPQRPSSTHILQNNYMGIQESLPPSDIHTTALLSLYNGMWHLHFPNLILVLMHLHSDSHSKVNMMSMELIGLIVFANCITIKPSLRQKMRPSS